MMEFFRLLGLQLEKILIVGFYASVSLWLKFLEEKLDTILYEGVVWSLCRKTCADLCPIPGFPLTLVRTSCQAAECEGKRMLWCELQHIFITLPPTGKSPVPWKHLQALTLPHGLISCSSTIILPKMGHTVLLNGLQTHDVFAWIAAFTPTISPILYALPPFCNLMNSYSCCKTQPT